jgi:thiamine kinase-like enzyme
MRKNRMGAVAGVADSVLAIDGSEAGERRLRRVVERFVERSLARPVTVKSLARHPSRFATLFPAEVLTIELDGGERLSLFLKHLGAQEQPDHPEKRCREREVRIYERLLGDSALPVVRFYGSDWNEESRRYELFLEYVDDLTLNYQELEHWSTAARRLAHLHAHFASRAGTLMECDFLLRLDEHHLHEWKDRAVTAVSARSAELAAKLSRIVERYDTPAAVLAAQSPTLVHNDLSPKNVIADRSATPARVFFIDWEMAGVGCGVMDIVQLKYGLDERDDRKMRAAYCDELAGTALLPSSRADLGSVFAACELHRTLHRLAHVNFWQTPLETIAHWIADTERLRASV